MCRPHRFTLITVLAPVFAPVLALALLHVPPAVAAGNPARPPWVQSGVHLSAPLERMLRAELAAGHALPPEAVRRWRLDVPDEDGAIADALERFAPQSARAEHTAVVGLAPDAQANNKASDASCSACGFRPLGQAETTIAAMGSNLVAGWNDGRGFCFPTTVGVQAYATSSDGGATWTDAGDPPLLPTGARWRGDPVHAVNRKTGHFYIAGLCEGGSLGSGLFLARGHFTAGVFTLDDNRQIASGGANFLDKEWMAADSLTGNLYVTYSNFIGGVNSQIELIRSTDNGLSWSPPLVLNSPAGFGNVQGSRPLVGPAGELYVVWYEYGFPLSHMRARRSDDLGVSFGPERTICDFYENGLSGAPGYRRGFAPTLPSAAIDLGNGPHRGRLYVGWDEAVDFYDAPFPGSPTIVTESEKNDYFLSATPFTVGNTLRGTIGAASDVDFWRFNGLRGQTLFFAADSMRDSLSLDVHLVCGADTSGTSNYRYLAYNVAHFPAIPFTLPADGTYDVRINRTSSPAVLGNYRIATTWDTPTPGERARDHRDRFVAHSDGGTTWSAPVRLNDDPGWFDGIFPELTVDDHGAVHAFWHDFRDDPGCGALSYEYMVSSGDGGATWGPNRRVSDVQSFWSFNACGSANQGDYQGFTSQGWVVYPCWADSRLGDPDVFSESATLRHAATCGGGVVVADDSTDAVIPLALDNPGNVDGQYDVTIVDTGGWITGISPPPGAGMNIAAGGSLPFSVTLNIPGFCLPAAWDTVTIVATDRFIPGRVVRCSTLVSCHLVDAVAGGPPHQLSFAAPRPNPSRGGVAFAFELPRETRVTLRVFAASGARLRTVVDGTMAAGAHEMVWNGRDDRGRALPPGMYWARLEAGGRSFRHSVVLVR